MTLPRPAEGLSWAIKVSLLGTPIVRRQLSGVLGLSFLFVALLLTLIFALDGTWEGLLLTLGVVVLVYLMLSVLALLVILVFFGNRIGMQFSLDSSGARSLITESRAEKAAQLALNKALGVERVLALHALVDDSLELLAALPTAEAGHED